MTEDQWVRRLCGLLKRYKRTDPGGLFRNAYADAVRHGLAGNAISKDDADLLGQARSYVETWASSSPPEPRDAFEQWVGFYEAGRGRLPNVIMEAVLSRFPKTKGAQPNWGPVILGTSEIGLLKILLRRRIIGIHDMIRIAKAKPSSFYQSAALDVLLERRKPCPRIVWDEYLKGSPRAASLLEPTEALVSSFAADRKADATKWLLHLLAESRAARDSILSSLLHHRPAALRLCRHLCLEPSKLSGARKKTREEEVAAVLIDWVAVCERALAGGGDVAATASVVLGLAQLSAIADSDALPVEVLTVLSVNTERISERAILLALKGMEAAGDAVGRGLALVVRGDALYRAVQKYLRELPTGTGGGDESPERTLRFERYMGRKEVIQGLLSSLRDIPEASAARDAVEVVLFNAGVREFGDSGQEVPFDAHSHEPVTPGILPRDPVLITHPGQRLGGEEDEVILVKAKVKPSHDPESKDGGHG